MGPVEGPRHATASWHLTLVTGLVVISPSWAATKNKQNLCRLVCRTNYLTFSPVPFAASHCPTSMLVSILSAAGVFHPHFGGLSMDRTRLSLRNWETRIFRPLVQCTLHAKKSGVHRIVSIASPSHSKFASNLRTKSHPRPIPSAYVYLVGCLMSFGTCSFFFMYQE